MQKEILLSYFFKITDKRYKELRRVFSSLDEAWKASGMALKQTGWDDSLIQEFLEWKKNLNENKIAATLEKENIYCVTLDDPRYPLLLKEIYDPPFCLFVRGKLPQPNPLVAVVGPRKPSEYGKQMTNKIIPELVNAGVTIVSGLAYGIDGLAHGTTLTARGNTIAVLAGGVDTRSVQPSVHKNLAEDIIQNGGAVISEYPPYTQPMNYSFPKRNRIIAGMTIGALVIEASENSGSLVTAQCALDNNREVFTLPQNITSPTSIGSNNLLKMGAKLVTSVEDILETLHVPAGKSAKVKKSITADSPTEAAILPWLKNGPVHIDAIIKNSGIESRAVNGTLTLMEIKGKIKNVGGMMYTLSL